MSRLATVVAGALVVALVAGCGERDGGGSADGDREAAPEGSVRYEDDRIAFTHPDGWLVEVDEGDEQRVRVQLRDEEDEPIAAVHVTWPVIHGDAPLEAFTTFFGVTDEELTVDELDESEPEVVGASETLLQRYRVTSADLGEDVAGEAWTLLATGEVGRNVAVTITLLDGAVDDPDELGDDIIGSVELAPSWEGAT